MKSILFVFSFFLAAEIGLYTYFQKEVTNFLTNIPAIQDDIEVIYYLFVLNIIPDCLRYMLRGPIKALAIQHQVTNFHLVTQGLCTPIMLYYSMVEF